jgi:hypothetical protein
LSLYEVSLNVEFYYEDGILYFSLDNEAYFNELGKFTRIEWDYVAEAVYEYAKAEAPSHFRRRSVAGISDEFRDHYYGYKWFGWTPGFGVHLKEADVGGLPHDVDGMYWERKTIAAYVAAAGLLGSPLF